MPTPRASKVAASGTSSSACAWIMIQRRARRTSSADGKAPEAARVRRQRRNDRVGTADITPITTNKVTLRWSSGWLQYQPNPLAPHQVRAMPVASTVMAATR